MRITLQYFDGCPNWKLMEQRLAQALVEAQVAGAEMVRERVESPEEAVRLGFRGSPTVLIDGKDPFASEWDSVGLACRVYRTANGEDGLPSVEELRTALVPMGGLGVGELGTWCAYDVVGIFGALRASGEARSTSPSSGTALEVHFQDGRPLAAELVLFRPDLAHLSCCRSVYDEWCPNSNFFESEEAAW